MYMSPLATDGRRKADVAASGVEPQRVAGGGAERVHIVVVDPIYTTPFATAGEEYR
jgi:hypothetical protein